MNPLGDNQMTQIQPFQQRVIDEHEELDEKLKKLKEFMPSAFFAGLPDAEQHRLQRQANAMHEYAEILSERIAAFGGEA